MTKYKLLPYQRDTTEFIKAMGRCGVYHDCGLGKTFSCFEALRELGIADKTLWITKASLVGNVAKEWAKLYGDKMPLTVKSYQWFLKEANIKVAALVKYKAIVLDESHFLKNWGAAMTRNILLGVAANCPRVIFMTATPYLKSAGDLHPMLSIIEPGAWGKFKDYKERYCNAEPDRFTPGGIKWVGVNERYADELIEAIKRVGVRQTRADIGGQLPPVQYNEVYFDVKATALKPQERRDWQRLIAEGHITEEIKSEFARAGVVKTAEVAEWLIDGDVRKSIVFFWHRKVGDILYDKLTAAGWKVGHIDGDVPQEERLEIVQALQNGELDTIVGSMAAMGEGLNINKAEHVVFAEGYWSYSVMHQALSRAVRLDTAHGVSVTRLIASESIDEAVYWVADNKREAAATLGVGFGGENGRQRSDGDTESYNGNESGFDAA